MTEKAPVVGVAGVVIAEGEVLLIWRGKAPHAGAWTLPGGRLEWGETLADGVRREVFEETGLRIEPVAIVATLDLIVPSEHGGVGFHYVLVEWGCRLADSTREPRAADDATDAKWVNLGDLQGSRLDASTLDVIGQAAGRLARVDAVG